MAYHKIYDSWAWVGGHSDGDSDLLHVAMKEAKEETGIKNVTPISENIYSLEIIAVNGHEKREKYVASHVHLNATYLLEADESEEIHIKEDVYKHMQKYMMNIVAKQKHLSMEKMEKVPCFYFLYSNIFLKVVRKTDLWESTQEHGKNYFNVTMKKCLWHTACVENDCAELCHLFCDVDNVTYGELKKLGFSRTKTLGYGEDCCDFHFYKK